VGATGIEEEEEEELYILRTKLWKELTAYFSLIRHGPRRKIRGDTQTHREKGDLIRFISLKNYCGAIRTDGQTDIQTARRFHKPPFICSK
jgi:hypothetical protein